MATGQTENFPVYPKHSRAARFAKKGAKKTANLFQDLLLLLAASVAAGIQFLWFVRRIVKPELELTVD